MTTMITKRSDVVLGVVGRQKQGITEADLK